MKWRGIDRCDILQILIFVGGTGCGWKGSGLGPTPLQREKNQPITWSPNHLYKSQINGGGGGGSLTRVFSLITENRHHFRVDSFCSCTVIFCWDPNRITVWRRIRQIFPYYYIYQIINITYLSSFCNGVDLFKNINDPQNRLQTNLLPPFYA